MIGYSLLNSKIQELCLSGIINSFLNRSVIYLYCLYLNYELEEENQKDIIINSLYNIFIQEELRLYPRLFKNFSDFKSWETEAKPRLISLYYIDDATGIIVEVKYDKNGGYVNRPLESKNYDDYPDLILKYILSSNLVFNKDYEFSKKSSEDVINDGKNNLKKLFRKNFEEFYNSRYFNSKDKNVEDNADYEAYFQSIYNQVTRIWNTAYDSVDKKENPFSNWWKMGGEKFTDEIRSLTNYLNDVSKKNNIDEKVEKQTFINKLNEVINTLKYARGSTVKSNFAYVDISNDVSVIIPKQETTKEFTPLDSKGSPINLKEYDNFKDSDGDLNLRAILDYFISILTFYYAKLTNQITIESSIRANIKKYIDNVRAYGAYPPDIKNKIVYEDDEKTTLNNLSNYFINNNGYINSFYMIKDVNGSEKEGILQFYKNKKLLEDREYYLGLLTSQINSLQTTKVDQEELSKEG